MSPGDQRVSLNINNNLDALKGAMSPGDQRVSLNINNNLDALKGAMSPGDQRMSLRSIGADQGPHRTGKTGKMAQRNPCQGKHRDLGIFQNAGNFACLGPKFIDSKDTKYCNVCREISQQGKFTI